MALRDLILGRRRRAAPENAGTMPLPAGTTIAPELARIAVEGDELPLTEASASGAGEVSGNRRREVVSRFATSVIPAAVAPNTRCDSVLDRLGLVHDAAEVRLTAEDGAAGFVVAARQIVFARFVMQDGFEEDFDFRPEPLSVDLAVRFCRVFAAFCARPLELTVEERSVAGVFGAEVGLAVADITFDEEVFRAHLMARATERADHLHETEATQEPWPVPQQAEATTDPESSPLYPVEEKGHVAKSKHKEKSQVKEEAAAPLTLTQAELSVAAQPAKAVAATDFPFAVLELCRANAEEVLRYTRAGVAALPAGGRATDGFSDELGAMALTTWHQKVSAGLGANLVIVFVPAASGEKVTLLAMDGESATAFRSARRALGSLCQTTLKAFAAGG